MNGWLTIITPENWLWSHLEIISLTDNRILASGDWKVIDLPVKPGQYIIRGRVQNGMGDPEPFPSKQVEVVAGKTTTTKLRFGAC